MFVLWRHCTFKFCVCFLLPQYPPSNNFFRFCYNSPLYSRKLKAEHKRCLDSGINPSSLHIHRISLPLWMPIILILLQAYSSWWFLWESILFSFVFKDFSVFVFFVFLFFFNLFLGLCYVALWDPSSLTRAEPRPSAVQTQGPNHWTGGKFPTFQSFMRIDFLWTHPPVRPNYLGSRLDLDSACNSLSRMSWYNTVFPCAA